MKKIRIAIAGAGLIGRRHAELIQRNGSCELSGVVDLKTYAGERSWFTPFATDTLNIARIDPLALQLEHFCAVIRGEAQALVSGRDAAQTLRVTLAIGEAARSGRIVSTPA